MARRELARESAIAKLDKYHLPILDDIAYVTKDQAETSVLFEPIGVRYERRSLPIAANQAFGEWGRVFPDKAMTLAAIDRLVHHATIFEMNVESYRPKSARAKAHGEQIGGERQLEWGVDGRGRQSPGRAGDNQGATSATNKMLACTTNRQRSCPPYRPPPRVLIAAAVSSRSTRYRPHPDATHLAARGKGATPSVPSRSARMCSLPRVCGPSLWCRRSIFQYDIQHHTKMCGNVN